MTKIGFIGSGLYRNKFFVLDMLEMLVWTDEDIIVSGHSPRYNYNNIDIWAENWAYDRCRIPPIIHPAKEFTREGFFARNKLISDDSERLIAFINHRQYRSGAWNTIKHFVEKGGVYNKDWIVYNERGEPWHTKDLPKWCLKKCK